MPAQHLLDKLIGCLWYAPFKCRACKAKFYRRSNTVPTRPAAQSGPASDVSRWHKDRAITLARVEHIIAVAEASRSRKG